MGAWIETIKGNTSGFVITVAPHVGAWIETSASQHAHRHIRLSHPMWVRGLKRAGKSDFVDSTVSHPMWVRGLKQGEPLDLRRVDKVAPHVGAWIETMIWSGAKRN